MILQTSIIISNSLNFFPLPIGFSLQSFPEAKGKSKIGTAVKHEVCLRPGGDVSLTPALFTNLAGMINGLLPFDSN